MSFTIIIIINNIYLFIWNTTKVIAQGGYMPMGGGQGYHQGGQTREAGGAIAYQGGNKTTGAYTNGGVGGYPANSYTNY